VVDVKRRHGLWGLLQCSAYGYVPIESVGTRGSDLSEGLQLPTQ
jgi:hypothetical protein